MLYCLTFCFNKLSISCHNKTLSILRLRITFFNSLFVINSDLTIFNSLKTFSLFLSLFLAFVHLDTYLFVPNCKGEGVKLQILGKYTSKSTLLFYENNLKASPTFSLRNLGNSPLLAPSPHSLQLDAEDY